MVFKSLKSRFFLFLWASVQRLILEMGRQIKQIYIRYSRYFPGYEIDDVTLHIEFQEGGDASHDAQVLNDVPWCSLVFEDNFEVQAETSEMTQDATARFDAAFDYICGQTVGLNKRKL